MASSTRTSVTLALFLVAHFSSFSEAAFFDSPSWSSLGIAGAPVAWRASTPTVRSPEETVESMEEGDGTCDVASFIFAGTELQRSSSGLLTSTQDATSSGSAGGIPGMARSTEAPPQLPDVELSGWEADFAAGVLESKNAVEAQDLDVGSWAFDAEQSGAAVPARMLRAEALLASAEEATANRWKEKTAERALRYYYHAKWLAERNYARAAEHRYREAARLAKNCRRSVLASHSLARLGYFLMHWKREAEATEVLQESMTLNTKSNPLAPYLHGVLERKASAGDLDRLRTAEAAIMESGEQPSEELEVERSRLMEEISYWREAEGSTRHCLASSDAAYVLICLCGHAAAAFRKFF